MTPPPMTPPPMTKPRRYALVQGPRLDLESFARAAGLHPDLVRRYLALGLLEATAGARGELWFAPEQLLAAARVQRLRAGLALNYAAVGLVVDLLDRIAELEAALRSSPRQSVDLRAQGGRSWTSIA
jgi:chaperone modulatory protein CbpM